MPRNEAVYEIFLASPADVAEERSAVAAVVDEVNRCVARPLGVRFELVRWETHAVPGIGGDPQAVINQQLLGDYDVFIGLLWHRFGTPTPRAGSGTEEEFLRTLDKNMRNPGATKLLFYFKDAPVDVSSIDIEQLKKVREFRDGMSDRGVLYGTFKSGEEFEKILRVHLSSTLHSLVSSRERDEKAEGQENIAHSANCVGSEIVPRRVGDAEVDFSKIMEELSSNQDNYMLGISGLASAAANYGECIEMRSQDISSAIRDGDVLGLRRAIDLSVKNLDDFSHETEGAASIFIPAVRKSTNLQMRLFELTVDSRGIDLGRVEEAAVSVLTLMNSIHATIEKASVFMKSIQDTPSVSDVYLLAQKRAINVMSELLEELESACSILAAVHSGLLSIKSRRRGPGSI